MGGDIAQDKGTWDNRLILPRELIYRRSGLAPDVGSSHPGLDEGPWGWAVRPLKWHASWVQKRRGQFGLYLSWAYEICVGSDY